ncbi:hypothetical protein EON63_06170 [archaeon]|nr:MAG: hypothetical protein EON63_06170 [archaeon]
MKLCRNVVKITKRSTSSSIGLDGTPSFDSNSVSSFDYYEEAMKKHRLLLQAQPDRMDLSIISQNGRAFDADLQLLDRVRTITFPSVPCTSLLNKQALMPHDSSGDVKLLVLSFKHYGFTVARSWLDPYMSTYHKKQSSSPTSSSHEAKKFAAIELCFFEHRFLSFAKGYVGSGVKKLVPVQHHDSTFLSFGNNLVRYSHIAITHMFSYSIICVLLQELGTKLLIPNFCTGYAYLLDKQNRIRWRGSGQAEPEEVKRMIELSRELANEEI